MPSISVTLSAELPELGESPGSLSWSQVEAWAVAMRDEAAGGGARRRVGAGAGPADRPGVRAAVAAGAGSSGAVRAVPGAG